MTNIRPLPQQRGAATLMLVLGLVLLATLASAYSSRAVLVDLLGSQARGLGLQARGAAQAALASGEATVLQAFADTPVQDLFADLSLSRPCPPELKGPQWQCLGLPLQDMDTLDNWQLDAWAARELRTSPHVWQLQGTARDMAGRGQAALRESVFVPGLGPVPDAAPTAAIVLNGCIAEAPGNRWRICPRSSSPQACSPPASSAALYSHFVPDTDGNGSLSATESQACLALSAQRLPGGGALEATSTPSLRPPCNDAAWKSVFGNTTREQISAWSEAQSRNGLHAQSQPARSIYWSDSPADWTQSLGSASAPVLLVFSRQACANRCPRIAAGVHIHGTVFVDAACDDEKMRGWQAGWIEGQLVVEGGLPALEGSSQIWARSYARQAYRLHWPEGMDAGRVQRVAGSQREGLQ